MKAAILAAKHKHRDILDTQINCITSAASHVDIKACREQAKSATDNLRQEMDNLRDNHRNS